MNAKLMTFVLALAMGSATASQECTPGGDKQSEVCIEPMPMQREAALLQATYKMAKSSEVSEARLQAGGSGFANVNPSGAAAPLTEEGYYAVADRCCQAEMFEFIHRAAFELGYEECHKGAVKGLTPHHSCEFGLQGFSKLNSDILRASTGECPSMGLVGTCKPKPWACKNYTGVNLTDCGCSRSKAAKLDFGAATLTANNLGGRGPTSGAEEMRFSSIGTSDVGEPFDLVVTTWSPQEHTGPAYVPSNTANNGENGKGFGTINMAQIGLEGFTGSTDFKFSFMHVGTNNPLVLSEVHMAIFDLDMEGYSGTTEIASSKGYKGYITDVEPNLAATLDNSTGRTKFKATSSDLANPTSPTALTTEQRRNSVMYFYSQVDSFELTFGTEPGSVPSEAGRNLFFAFESSLNNRCGP